MLGKLFEVLGFLCSVDMRIRFVSLLSCPGLTVESSLAASCKNEQFFSTLQTVTAGYEVAVMQKAENI